MIVSMETNLSFCEGEHLSPVTNKQLDEFVDLPRRSVVLQENYTTVERMLRKELKL